MAGAEGRQRGQADVDQRDRHQLDAERLSALSGDQQGRRCRERRREQPEHDLGPAAKHRVLDHRSQVYRDHDEDESQQRRARADKRDAEVAPGSGIIGGVDLRNMPYRRSFQNRGPR